MLPSTDPYIDVVELCALLQCLGFGIKSLDTTDGNVSEEGTRTVTINCQASGIHVVLDSANFSCSCPSFISQQNSGFWQVSGMTGGKEYSKECGSALLGSLPKPHRERLTKELQDIVRCIKEHNESDVEKKQETLANKSASMIELKTPEKRQQLKPETPTRYRSLDALTAKDDQLPAPGPLTKDDDKKYVCQRQSTYTLSSTPESSRLRNKTSSPIPMLSQSLIDNLIATEKLAEDLRKKISNIIHDFVEDAKHDNSMSSLALDVSKISTLKGPESSKQFASSPNLSGLGVHDDYMKRFRRVESASTSNLTAKPAVKEGKLSKLKRISPNLFKFKNSPSAVNRRDKSDDVKSNKTNSLTKSKIATPVRVAASTENSPNVSGSRRKFGQVKSTIPRLASKKE
ncbi:uncharacterized protein LOC116771309 isoform X2 [Danaus plexippus]|uniref:uncharacterized protein LOC116771309 isoform X2 n=1 Tax=Danaus plexippus TaxID=13037 RepID=UPI002AAF84E7|nr:uncharacterized protein LOC116771309 isoform X2 [Danaus plexippus]